MRRGLRGLIALVLVASIAVGGYTLGTHRTRVVSRIAAHITTTESTFVFYFSEPPTTAEPAAPLVVELTDPAVLRQALDAAAIRLIGRSAYPADYSEFVAEYHAVETQNARAERDGGTVVRSSPDASAEAFIERVHPDDVRQYTYLKNMQMVADMMRGNPTTTSSSTSSTCPYSYRTTTTERYGYAFGC